MSNSYAILLITRNGIEYTRRCLKSIESEKPNILVIDNGSSDGTQRYLRTLHSMTVLTSKFNSLAAAWNWGLTACFTRNSHVLVINNDTELLPHTAKNLMDQFQFISEADGHYPGMVTGISTRHASSLYYPVVWDTPSPHPDFSCFMISKQCFETVGHFDESYLGAYCEDCDYHIRMHRAGYRALSINLPFLHHGSGTLRSSDVEVGETIRQQADANRERLFAKWGARPGTPEYDALFTEESFGVGK